MAQMVTDRPAELPENLLQERLLVNFEFSDDQLAIRNAIEAICADHTVGVHGYHEEFASGSITGSDIDHVDSPWSD